MAIIGVHLSSPVVSFSPSPLSRHLFRAEGSRSVAIKQPSLALLCSFGPCPWQLLARLVRQRSLPPELLAAASPPSPSRAAAPHSRTTVPLQISFGRFGAVRDYSG